MTQVNSAYSALMDRRPGDIVRVSCLVHIRRKFMDMLGGKEAGGTASEAAIAKINEMFHVDNGFATVWEFDDPISMTFVIDFPCAEDGLACAALTLVQCMEYMEARRTPPPRSTSHGGGGE